MPPKQVMTKQPAAMKRPAASSTPKPCLKRPAAGQALFTEPEKKFSTTKKFLQNVWRKLGPEDQEAIKASMAPPRNRMASMCSGSGMAELIHHCLAKSIGKQSRLLFSCECVPFKQVLLHQVHEVVGSPDACCFKEFAELSSGVGNCAAHDIP